MMGLLLVGLILWIKWATRAMDHLGHDNAVQLKVCLLVGVSAEITRSISSGLMLYGVSHVRMWACGRPIF